MLYKQTVFDFPINLGSYTDFVNEIMFLASSGTHSFVCFANVHQLIEAYRNPPFASMIQHANLVAPDGMPLTWALKLLCKIKQERVAGMDLLPCLLKEAEVRQFPVFFYGGTNQMLDKTKEYLRNKYPELILSGFYSPPFRQLSENEDEEVVNVINNSGAKLVFVILGCPKQERWMASMKEKINGTMIGIGAAVPVMIASKKRAPKWMQKSGLEWFYRFFQEPQRLWKRYLVTNSIFIYLLLREEIRLKRGKHPFSFISHPEQ